VSFYVLDASVWVARLVPQDAFHQTIKNWMAGERTVGSQFISPSLLLAEVAGAISRRTTAALGRKALKSLEAMPGLRIIAMQDVLLHEAAALAADLGLRGADSVYVAVARHLDVPLLTFDAEQRERGKKAVTIHEID